MLQEIEMSRCSIWKIFLVECSGAKEVHQMEK